VIDPELIPERAEQVAARSMRPSDDTATIEVQFYFTGLTAIAMECVGSRGGVRREQVVLTAEGAHRLAEILATAKNEKAELAARLDRAFEEGAE
jgi:hypothetical protein